MKLIAGILLLSGISAYAQTEQAVKDIDGNVYKTVKIGNQVWMAENLKTTKYSDQRAIPYIADTAYITDTIPAYYLYNNDPANMTDYGLLYNWYVVNTGKLCPAGWHVPSNEEWDVLTKILGGENAAGGKLKETGTKHWNKSNSPGSNESGFTAIPGGYRNIFGKCEGLGTCGAWWSSSAYGNGGAYIRTLSFDNSKLTWNVPAANCYFPVRCLEN